jgi:hypothetical protein
MHFALQQSGQKAGTFSFAQHTVQLFLYNLPLPIMTFLAFEKTYYFLPSCFPLLTHLACAFVHILRRSLSFGFYPMYRRCKAFAFVLSLGTRKRSFDF